MFFLLAKEAQTQLWLAPGPQDAVGCIVSKALPHEIQTLPGYHAIWEAQSTCNYCPTSKGHG